MKIPYKFEFYLKNKLILSIVSIGAIFLIINPLLLFNKPNFTNDCGYEAMEGDGNVSLAYRCGISPKHIFEIWHHNIKVIDSIMDPNQIYAYFPLSWDISSFDYEGSEKDLSQIMTDVDTLSNILLISAEIAHRENLCFRNRKIEAKIWELSLIWMSAIAAGPLRHSFPKTHENFEYWSIFRRQIIMFSRLVLKRQFAALKDCSSEMKLNDIITAN